MSPTHLASFMPRRFHELVEVLHASGFDVADNTHPLYPNEWTDAPPVGIVRVKGVWLPHADAELDAEEDKRVTVTLSERWSETEATHATVHREGLWLAGYGYNGHVAGAPAGDGRRNHRHDFDVTKEEAIVFHLHPLGHPNKIRHAEPAVGPEEAIQDLLAQVASEIASGGFTMLPHSP